MDDGKKVTDPNAPPTPAEPVQATANPEESKAKKSEGNDQKNNQQLLELQAKVKQYEDNLAKMQKERDLIKQERDAAAARASNLDRTYKGLQASTTDKLQRLAILESQMGTTNQLESKMARMEALIEELAAERMDDEARRRVNDRVVQAQNAAELARLKAQQEASQQRRVVEQPNPQRNTLGDASQIGTPAWKRAVLREYFDADSEAAERLVDNPNIDWALDASSEREWFRRAGASIRKVEYQERENNALSVLRQQEEERLKEINQETESKIQALQEQIEQLSGQKKAEDRKEKETANRERGMDRIDNVRPQSIRDRKVVDAMLALDDSVLKSKDQKKINEYQAQLRALRDQALKAGIVRR